MLPTSVKCMVTEIKNNISIPTEVLRAKKQESTNKYWKNLFSYNLYTGNI